ncbi:RsmD family RNA methyltransferase [Candidatus Vidania fulgoroideorum]
MKILSGLYKGKKIVFSKKNKEYIKPTKSIVKKTLFNIIEKKIKNKICVDLFCGTGSLGLEAISRGAKKVYLVDNKKKIIKTISKFIKKNKIKNTFAINSDYNVFLNEQKKKFDVIFIDAPYKMYKNIQSIIIDCSKRIKKNGFIYYENYSKNFKKELLVSGLTSFKVGKKGKILYFIFKK